MKAEYPELIGIALKTRSLLLQLIYVRLASQQRLLLRQNTIL